MTTTYVSDNFNRSQGTGFGSAQTGGNYSHNSNDVLSVNGSRGQMALTSGLARKAFLLTPNVTDSDITVKVRIGTVTGGGEFSIFARVNGWAGSTNAITSEECYKGFVSYGSNGSMTLEIGRNNNGSNDVNYVNTSLGGSGTLVAGDDWWLRFQLEGNDLRLKAWKDGTSEPGTWTLTTTQTFAASGGFGLHAYSSSGSKTVEFDDFGATDLAPAFIAHPYSFGYILGGEFGSIEEEEEPVDPDSLWGPPVSSYDYYATPSVSLPDKFDPITDPTFGTTITRISDAGKRHYYSRIQAWSPSETYLHFGYGRQLLNGQTYEVITSDFPNMAAPTWIDDQYILGPSGADNRIYIVDCINNPTSRSTFMTLSGWNDITFGDYEGQLSEDKNWAVVQGTKTNGDKAMAVVDLVEKEIVSEWVVTTLPNNCTMSKSGEFVLVTWNSQGSDQGKGNELYDRNLDFVRHLDDSFNHSDPGWDADGREVVVINKQSMPCIDLLTGDRRNLASSSASWMGHTSCFGPPGWVVVGSDEADTNSGKPGSDVVISLAMDGSRRVKFWGHTHHFSSAYEAETHAHISPSGGRVIFASDWGTGNYYAFVASVE